MTERQPTAPPVESRVTTLPDKVPLTTLTWAQARTRLAAVETYLLATVRPDTRPHVVPVLGVWLDGALHFNTGSTARKARNLTRNPHCVLTAAGDDLDLVIEGDAAKVTDTATLQRVADAFPAKYPWWHPTVRDGAFRDPDTDEPREVFAVAPALVFAFGKERGLTATRWSF
jgi:nitroimidazol reductase NimA-like FMN-containing flavoprotein (pyridoxamine 5'-phosphate oxidase superfamily)